MIMATTKKRINVSIPHDVEKALYLLAAKDGIPPATKAALLIQYAIEMNEDELLSSIASQREKDNTHFISHEDAWGNV